jgi:NADPH:quinone reductase-like Zn-dependent oxidoreductase
MKAVAFDRFGGPEVLFVADLPDPEPGPGQVRVRVHAATVNPTDTLFRAGKRPFDPAEEPPPWTPGQELAGVVDRVGDGVTRWEPGDGVIAVTRPAPGVRGAQSELALVFADSIAPRPTGVPMVEAATLPMNGLTARQALDLSGAGPGDTLLVTGAAGAVGGYVLQLARHEAIRTIATAGSADEAALVRSLGAAEVVDRGPGLGERVRALEPGGVAAAVDAALVGGPLAGAVRDGGRLVALRGWSEAAPGRGIEVASVAVARELHAGDRLEALARLVDEGVLALRVARVLRPEDAAEAHRLVEAGGLRGRVVLDFGAAA